MEETEETHYEPQITDCDGPSHDLPERKPARAGLELAAIIMERDPGL